MVPLDRSVVPLSPSMGHTCRMFHRKCHSHFFTPCWKGLGELLRTSLKVLSSPQLSVHPAWLPHRSHSHSVLPGTLWSEENPLLEEMPCTRRHEVVGSARSWSRSRFQAVCVAGDRITLWPPASSNFAGRAVIISRDAVAEAMLWGSWHSKSSRALQRREQAVPEPTIYHTAIQAV